MPRRTIPVFEMSVHGEETIRQGGFVAMPVPDSLDREPQRLKPHYHEFFQVALLLGNGGLMHDFRETAISGATLLFFSPGQVHAIRPEKGMHGTIVSFTREFFELHSPSAHHGLLYDMPFFHAVADLPWMSLDAKEEKIARQIFKDIQEEFDTALSGAEAVLRAQLHILFVRASRWHASRRHEASTGRSSALVRGFYQALERHSREWHAVGPYAKTLGVTVNHLNDVIAAGTGTPAGTHIRRARLLDAKRLLLHSDLSVAEIGYLLGFQDPSYFGRFFRREQDMTPAEFREKIRKKYHK